MNARPENQPVGKVEFRPSPAPSEGAEMIRFERARQICEEGYTAEHDDAFERPSSLVLAAICYAEAAETQLRGIALVPAVPEAWPWLNDDWKPSTDPLVNLKKAGALIAAQMDKALRVLAKYVRPARVLDPADVTHGKEVAPPACPKCGSHKPNLFPAVQHEGEVAHCTDPFHEIVTPENTVEAIEKRRKLWAPPAGQTHVEKSRLLTIESEGLHYTVLVFAENAAELDEYPSTPEMLRMFRRLGDLEGRENVDPPGRGLRAKLERRVH